MKMMMTIDDGELEFGIELTSRMGNVNKFVL